MKRVSHLRVGGKPIRSAEGVILYLIKYLAKSFQMRENKELAEKVGLLPGMGIYKFFRVIYGYDGERTYIAQKRKKPLISSQVFINNDYGFTEQVEKEFSDYFDENLRLKKQARQILKQKEPQPANNGKITDLLKLSLNEYEPLAEYGESADSREWRANIPPELIYNHIYLKEIRSQISHYTPDYGLNADEAAKRYADY
ncbi:7131_t:CDS:2 [Ambispora gerdemannii]|uniref:7131_t:CDS:1 n=1 Tax=Ambispora gerdemannii TaxID=144530 RepID=A0A9N9F5H5_9GLOM|nr:7131_t:CDS:2 [Ambispora gerdemannii]